MQKQSHVAFLKPLPADSGIHRRKQFDAVTFKGICRAPLHETLTKFCRARPMLIALWTTSHQTGRERFAAVAPEAPHALCAVGLGVQYRPSASVCTDSGGGVITSSDVR
jgi:hypothetical protein